MNKKEVAALALVALAANAVTVLQHNMRRKPTPKPASKPRPRDNDLCAAVCASRVVGRRLANGHYSTQEQVLTDFEFEVIVHNLR